MEKDNPSSLLANRSRVGLFFSGLIASLPGVVGLRTSLAVNPIGVTSSTHLSVHVISSCRMGDACMHPTKSAWKGPGLFSLSLSRCPWIGLWGRGEYEIGRDCSIKNRFSPVGVLEHVRSGPGEQNWADGPLPRLAASAGTTSRTLYKQTPGI